MFDCLEDHCSASLNVVSDTHFESAICKIQHQQICNIPLTLNTHEAKRVKHFKIMDLDTTSDFSDAAEENDDDYDKMEVLLTNIKRPKLTIRSPYIDCRFIRPTSNMCE